jgi:hypothetical protein
MYRVVDVIELPRQASREACGFTLDCQLVDSIVLWVLSPRSCHIDRKSSGIVERTVPMTAAVLLLLAHTEYKFEDRQFELGFEQW